MTYKLFANCIPVKGSSKSIIMDIQRNNYKNIPNSLFEILSQNEILDFEKLKIEFNNTNIINEYKNFLIKNEFLFECSINEVQKFPRIATTFEKPYHISNAVIEFSEESFLNLSAIKESFDNLGIQDCFLIFYEENNQKLLNFLELFNDSRLLSIQIITKYSPNINYQKISTKYPRLTNVILHSSLKNKKKEFITYTTKKMSNFNFCGAINGYFTINIDTFTESLNHNSCLNRKITIDKDGNIKNCPSMVQSFGNIKDTTLEEALQHKDFKKYWNITKDQIEVCKDCEFRHMCTDCRAYVEDPENQYSKPLKCGYSPYTNEWEEWSTNPLKQKAIEYYGMQELVKG
ncbi:MULTISPECIES: grasp-with-spasm system SPASM domain peptide maturase [Flavobacterium]|uniref:Grasp-with-spasm system SPASM domain peptide maturase n=1 Tax=Flavobacterium jumunjinense TaxID=998845 RepID=A0ABV5GKD1_9FLAO|nr:MULTISPECIES: grasp-with-spasm system SPASM domain peptide maturase [Flavobacterium]